MKAFMPYGLLIAGVLLISGSYIAYQTKYTSLKTSVDNSNRFTRDMVSGMYGQENVGDILSRGRKTDTGYYSLTTFNAPDAAPYYFTAGVGALLSFAAILIFGLRPASKVE
jgi:hypothetical protein